MCHPKRLVSTERDGYIESLPRLFGKTLVGINGEEKPAIPGNSFIGRLETEGDIERGHCALLDK